jgi:GMP synthase PP-ATPase subunit
MLGHRAFGDKLKTYFIDNGIMREGESECWDSDDAVTGSPTRLPYEILEKLASRITSEVPGLVSATYNISSKLPSTIEAL